MAPASLSATTAPQSGRTPDTSPARAVTVTLFAPEPGGFERGQVISEKFDGALGALTAPGAGVTGDSRAGRAFQGTAVDSRRKRPVWKSHQSPPLALYAYQPVTGVICGFCPCGTHTEPTCGAGVIRFRPGQRGMGADGGLRAGGEPGGERLRGGTRAGNARGFPVRRALGTLGWARRRSAGDGARRLRRRTRSTRGGRHPDRPR
jgi:hypothetical protein